MVLLKGQTDNMFLVKWNSMSTTQRLIVSAVAKGWVEVVSEIQREEPQIGDLVRIIKLRPCKGYIIPAMRARLVS
jgi:hypothetical protein